MAKLILFSTPSDKALEKVLPALVTDEAGGMRVAYVTSDGLGKYDEYWRGLLKSYKVESFAHVDHRERGEGAAKMRKKLLDSNVVLLTGGNTFGFLHGLRESGLLEALQTIVEREDVTVAGFSAGALLMCKDIGILNSMSNYDENLVGVTDFKALGWVDFDVAPHYTDQMEKEVVQYEQSSGRVVKRLSDDDVLIVEK